MIKATTYTPVYDRTKEQEDSPGFIDKRTLKNAWWILKDRRDWLVHGEPPTGWTDKVAMAKEVQRIMDLIEVHFKSNDPPREHFK
jgi:hypothetical protein